MEFEILTQTDTLFEYGVYLAFSEAVDGGFEDATYFFGTRVYGQGLSYDVLEPAQPISGDVKRMTTTFENDNFGAFGHPDTNERVISFTFTKLPDVETMTTTFNTGWFLPFEIFNLAAAIDGERMLGSELSDTFASTDADDDFRGLNGDDAIFGGLGDDALRGGAGEDGLFGEAGNDTLLGGSGNDYIEGGADNDTAKGGAGNDQIDGGDGNDLVEGGNGDDQLMGGLGEDIVKGGKGNDLIQGGFGDDILEGGKGDDFVQGVAGNDVLRGGEGADVFMFTQDIGAEGTMKVRDFSGTDDLIALQSATDRSAEQIFDIFSENATQVGGSVLYDDPETTLSVLFVRTELEEFTVESFYPIFGYSSPTF